MNWHDKHNIKSYRLRKQYMENIKTKKKNNKEMQSIQPSKSKEKKNNSDDHKNCHQNGNV